MARDIDERKKQKALRKLRQAAERAKAEGGPGLSDWEQEFVEEVEARVERYGSAFGDLEKGASDEPLSRLQQIKLKEIDKKSRGKDKPKAVNKSRSSFKPKKGKSAKESWRPRVRDIHEDVDAPDIIEDEAEKTGSQRGPRLIASNRATKRDTEETSPKRAKRPALKLIKGKDSLDD